MEEHAPKLQSTDTLRPEGHQVPELTDNDEVYQDILDPGAEYDYYSSDEEFWGEDSDTE